MCFWLISLIYVAFTVHEVKILGALTLNTEEFVKKKKKMSEREREQERAVMFKTLQNTHMEPATGAFRSAC